MDKVTDIINGLQKRGAVLDSAMIEDAFNMPGITNELAQRDFLERYGQMKMFDKLNKGKKMLLPTVSRVLDALGLEDDPEGMQGGKEALNKFIDGFAKNRNDYKQIIEDNPEFGKRGWEFIAHELYPQLVRDAAREQTRKERMDILEGRNAGPMEAIGGIASKFFTPRLFEAYAQGNDPTWKDYAGDALETAAMMVPASRYAKVVPNKIKNKLVENVVGNSIAPIIGEAMDAAMRGDDDPNTDRQDFSAGDAAIGALTNLGVNFGLAQRLGIGGRIGEGELKRSSQSGVMGKVREAIGDMGKSRAERGLGLPIPNEVIAEMPKSSARVSNIINGIVDASEMGAPTLLVNRYGSDKDAKIGSALLGSFVSSNPMEALDSMRTKEHKMAQDRKTGREISALLDGIADERDRRYLEAIKKNPDIVKFGLAGDNDNFKRWLIERGQRLIENTGAHRPSWEIK